MKKLLPIYLIVICIHTDAYFHISPFEPIFEKRTLFPPNKLPLLPSPKLGLHREAHSRFSLYHKITLKKKKIIYTLELRY